jgi:peptide/nickel transport system ATP-binding protein
MTQPQSTQETLLEVLHLSKTFTAGNAVRRQYVQAVNDVSFSIGQGKVTVIVGESGSGKSTVARLIARLIDPTSGTIRFGSDTFGVKMGRRQKLRLRSRVQMIFQDPFGSLNPFYTIGAHLVRPLKNFGQYRGMASAHDRMRQVLDSVGLTPADTYIHKYPHELSGGQRQRVVIARALMIQPALILADEPTSMLDVSIRIGILNLMKKLQQEHQLSYLFITHDLASARYLGDDLLVMYAGSLVEGGTADDVVTEPAHPYTRLLLSAVPDPANPHAAEGSTYGGEPPNLSQLPQGCTFHPRCPFAMDVCRTNVPGRTELGGGHWVTCHLHEEH